MEEFAEDFGLAIKEILYSGEAFLGFALDHVASESPGRGSKSENRHVWAGVLYGAAKRLHQEAGFDLGIEDAEFFYIGGGADGLGEIGSLVVELEGEAHGFGGDEN